MFKIVETTERGSKKLSIVPGTWEKNNELSWPKFKADKLIRLSDSKPEESWFRMRCKLKRRHFISYNDAEQELERMLENGETTEGFSTEQEETADKRRKRSRLTLSKQQNHDDFNNADTCLVSFLQCHFKFSSTLNYFF